MRTLAGGQKARPSGAKGQCFIGTFTPTAEAKGLSASLAFEKPSRVVARFSVGSGNPKVMDGNKTVNRGFAFRIDAGGRGQSEFVMVNAPVNFVKSPDQMLAFLQARLPGADGKPDPAKIKAFTDTNPETTNQGKYLAGRPVPGSWVGVSYWGIHGYTLVNASGAKQLVKFQMVPTAGEIGLTDDEAKGKPADFLVDELKGRIDKQNLALGGYDPVAYFTLGKATAGKTEFSAVHEGATYRFASAAHRSTFVATPARFLPQYGGYCAYAASQGYKADADPKAWHVIDGRLFVNYNASVAKSWAAKSAGYIKAGDANWARVKALPAQ